MFDVKSCNAKEFTDSDVKDDRLPCLKADLIYNPPEWLARGLQETASGYGRRLNSGYSIRFEGRTYRIYVIVFGNNGTCYFTSNGRRIIVSAH